MADEKKIEFVWHSHHNDPRITIMIVYGEKWTAYEWMCHIVTCFPFRRLDLDLTQHQNFTIYPFDIKS